GDNRHIERLRCSLLPSSEPSIQPLYISGIYPSQSAPREDFRDKLSGLSRCIATHSLSHRSVRCSHGAFSPCRTPSVSAYAPMCQMPEFMDDRLADIARAPPAGVAVLA